MVFHINISDMMYKEQQKPVKLIFSCLLMFLVIPYVIDQHHISYI